MALPSTLYIDPQPWRAGVFGKAINFVPGDPTIPVEIQRASDAAGTGATTIATGLLFPKPGAPYVDQRANNGSSWFYRARHAGPGYDAGAYTSPWVGGVVKPIPKDVLAASVNFGGGSVYPIIRAFALDDGKLFVGSGAPDVTTVDKVWAQLHARPGSHSQQMLPNSGLEDGLVYFRKQAGNAVAVVTDSTKAHSGNNYLQVSSTTGVQTVAEAADDTGASRYFEVNPGDVVQWGGWAYRESGTDNVNILLQATDKDKASPANVFTPNQNTAAWVFVQGQYVVPAGVKFVRWLCQADGSGTATVARFDDVFLRIAFAASTVHNPQGSIAPTAIPAGFYTYASAGPTLHMWLSWGWSSTDVTRADRSTLNIPAAPAAPAAPTLSQVAGGALAARTRWARIAYVKSRRLYPVSAESSFAISVNNLLKVQAPTDPGGGLYDGWAVLVGSASNGEIHQSNTQVFGVDWTEPVGGFVTTFTPWASTWKSITSVELSDNVTVQEYGFYDLTLALMRIVGGGANDGPSTSTSAVAAAKQNGDGMVPLSLGAMPAIIPVGGGSNGGNGGGKFL